MVRSDGERCIALGDLADRVASEPAEARRLICLAGPPGCGKSHVADALRGALVTRGCPSEILGLDGYHYDDAVLGERGLLMRKGAPETFDAEGFAHMLDRLSHNEEAEIAIPVFDRSLEIARAGARVIPQATGLVIVEGNYLLLDRPPWSGLAPRFDVKVRLSASEDTLRTRLTRRWVDLGFPPEETSRRVEENDLPNCRLVLSGSVPGDFVLSG